MEYSYSPLLNQTHARLITLRAGHPNDPLHVEITTVDVSEQLSYEALSYVWGPRLPTSTVIIHSNTEEALMPVGPNLAQALIHLRYQEKSRTLWIDALCINQQDLDERAQQVQLMADIYRRAERVLIWLGPEQPTIYAAFDLINQITAQFGRELDSRRGIFPATATTEHRVKYPHSSHPGWQAVRLLLQNKWFKRVWTFQEIAFAKTALLCCGFVVLNWDTLQAMIMSLAQFLPGPLLENRQLDLVENVALQMCAARQCHQGEGSFSEGFERGGTFDLLTLVDGLRENEAADPRDKIYALLNVAMDNPAIEVDYRKSTAEVYATVVKWSIATHRNLGFLSQVEKKDKPDLISWLPDFRSRDYMNFMHQGRFYKGFEHQYRAAGSSRASLPDAPQFHLPVRGIRVGTILERTDRPGNFEKGQTLGKAVLDGGQWQAFARSHAMGSNYAPTGEAIDAAFHRMRIWDVLPHERGADRRRRTSPLGDLSNPGDISHVLTADSFMKFSGHVDSLGTRFLAGTTRKCMFWTDSGYLGIARKTLAVYDDVYVLMGADLPVILRKVGEGMYSFEGEAYVHGIMDGELLLKARARQEKSDVGSLEIDGELLEALADMESEDLPFDTEELVLV